MALAKAPWRALSTAPTPSYLQLGICTSAIRLASSAPRKSVAAAPRKTINAGAKSVKRFIPEDVKRFIKSDGKLLTTRENRDFLLQYDLEPDNGRMTKFTSGPDLSKLASDFNATFAYSPRHIIHPHDLRYFEPRGHPLAAMKRSEYVRKTREQPMWIMITSVGGASAVVRTLTQRRMTRAVYAALEKLGYGGTDGGSRANSIRGTLWVTVHDPIKAARQSPERFGRIVGAALQRQCDKRST